MRNLTIKILTIFLTVFGAALTIKALNSETVFTAAPLMDRAPSRQDSAATLPTTTEIVPAAVIDRSEQPFVGTGDASVGGWSKP